MYVSTDDDRITTISYNQLAVFVTARSCGLIHKPKNGSSSYHVLWKNIIKEFRTRSSEFVLQLLLTLAQIKFLQHVYEGTICRREIAADRLPIDHWVPDMSLEQLTVLFDT